MSDLLYLATHPLAAAIHDRLNDLRDEADSLPKGSHERRALEKRIAALEEYHLPRPDDGNKQMSTLGFDAMAGKYKVESIRRRYQAAKRGRPATRRLAIRAALDEKLADPKLTWRVLAQKYGFGGMLRTREDGEKITVSGVEELSRAVRKLKILLKCEGIPLPNPSRPN